MLLEEANMKNYNVLSAQGITDIDMLETNGGPVKYAGTPKINSWMIQKVYKDNLESGMSREEANIRRVEAQKTVKYVKQQRGY